MSLSKIRTQQSRAVHGAWVTDDKHLFEGVSLKVRGRWNPDSRSLEARLTAELSRKQKLANGNLKPEEADRILNEVILKTVLVDWDNLREDEDAEPIPYTEDKAREFLEDPLLKPFKDAVLLASVLVAEEGKETLEDDAKN